MIRRVALGAATALVAALTISVPSAQAVPVFSESDMDSFWNAFPNGLTPCTISGDTGSTELSDKPVAETGAPTTGAQSSSGTITNDGDNTDSMSWTASMSGTDRITTKQGNLDTMSLVATGAINVTTTKPVSACVLGTYTGLDMDFTFTVTKAGFLDVQVTGKGPAFAEYSIGTDDSEDHEFEIYADRMNSSASGRVYLTPGVYSGFMEADANFKGSKALSGSAKVTVTGAFHLAGSKVGKTAGSGKKYTVLPSKRTCPKGKAKVKITSNKGRSVQIKSVEYFVNDKQVKKTGNTGPGSSVQLKAPGAEDMSIRAVTTLKNGAVVEATADYLPCTG